MEVLPPSLSPNRETLLICALHNPVEEMEPPEGEAPIRQCSPDGPIHSAAITGGGVNPASAPGAGADVTELSHMPSRWSGDTA